MRYPIVIHHEEGSAYGVAVPDLPGCFSAGDSLNDAVIQAQEAIACHLEGMIDDGDTIPAPQNIDIHQTNPEFSDGVWVLVDVDLSKLDSVTKRYNISAPKRAMAVIDAVAHQVGEHRSEFLLRAAMQRVEREAA